MATYPSPTLQDLTVQGTASIATVTSADATITGGTVDGTVIGGTTPAAVSATNLKATGTATLAGVSATSLVLPSQTANEFYASPSGSAGAPSFRAMTATDVPELTATQMPAFTGDATSAAGSTALTLAASGVTAGTYGSASNTLTATVDAKGRITALTTNAIASGSVSSVGLAAPSIFAVSGTPITSAGTLTLALASQAANTVFASPSGAAGGPSFRSLVLGDLPSGVAQLAASQTFTGSVTFDVAPTIPTGTDAQNSVTYSQLGTFVGPEMPGVTPVTYAGSSSSPGTVSLGSAPRGYVVLTKYYADSPLGSSSQIFGLLVTRNTNPDNTPTTGDAGNWFHQELYLTNNAKYIRYNTNGAGWTAWMEVGAVTSLSVVSANGFAGTVATNTTTPAITLETSVTGILHGNGTSVAAAVAANFPLLNQNTTGNAATATTATNQSGGTVSATTGAFSSALSGTTATFSGALSASNFNTQIAPSSLAIGTSPWIYKNTNAGGVFVYFIGVTAVSSILQISKDNSTYYQIGVTSVMNCYLPAGWYFKLTYSTAPSIDPVIVPI